MPLTKPNSVTLLLNAALLVLVSQQFTLAGPLGDFEEAATKSSKKSESVRVGRDADSIYSEDESGLVVTLIDELMGAVFDEIFNTRKQQRGPYDADPWSMPRPTIVSTQEFNVGLQSMMLSKGIRGEDYSAEYKKDRLILGVSSTRLNDTNSDEILEMNYYRFGITDPIADQWQWSASVGYIEMIGEDKHGGIGLSTPIYWQASNGLSIEVEPTWYNIKDQWTHAIDTRLRIPKNNFGLQVGYRYWQTEDESLYGPYAGIDIRW